MYLVPLFGKRVEITQVAPKARWKPLGGGPAERDKMQQTLKAPVTFEGPGLHSGQPARMTIRPASAEHGVWFRRTDIKLGDTLVPARWDVVEQTPLCTKLVNGAGVSVSTVEHVMAALSGCGVHNAVIELDGPEAPILDGSSLPFVKGLMQRGLRAQDAPVRAFEILKPVEVQVGAAKARLEPADGLIIDFHIDFPDPAIGDQSRRLNMANGAFVRELCDSRTFCRKEDVEMMRAAGLIKGGTLDNAVVVDGAKVLTPGGLRHDDEAVRHKMLDALGDLALAGAPILGRYIGSRAGHAVTNTLLRALFADPTAFRMVVCSDDQTLRLPGAGLAMREIPQVA